MTLLRPSAGGALSTGVWVDPCVCGFAKVSRFGGCATALREAFEFLNGLKCLSC